MGTMAGAEEVVTGAAAVVVGAGWLLLVTGGV